MYTLEQGRLGRVIQSVCGGGGVGANKHRRAVGTYTLLQNIRPNESSGYYLPNLQIADQYRARETPSDFEVVFLFEGCLKAEW